MKFGIGVRIEGKSGGIQGLQGCITGRLRIDTQNLVLIRWDNGVETRLTTGAVRFLGVGGRNQVVNRNNQVAPVLQPPNIDANIPDESVIRVFRRTFYSRYGRSR